MKSKWSKLTEGCFLIDWRERPCIRTIFFSFLSFQVFLLGPTELCGVECATDGACAFKRPLDSGGLRDSRQAGCPSTTHSTRSSKFIDDAESAVWRLQPLYHHHFCPCKYWSFLACCIYFFPSMSPAGHSPPSDQFRQRKKQKNNFGAAVDIFTWARVKWSAFGTKKKFRLQGDFADFKERKKNRPGV